MSRFDWRRLPPQVLLAVLATGIVVPIIAWQEFRGGASSTGSEAAVPESPDLSADAGDEVAASPSTTTLAIQPGWVPKGSSRYGDNGSGGDALPIITTPVPRVNSGATTTVPARVKDPKTTTTTTTTTAKPRTAPSVTSPPANAPPATAAPPPPATEPPPTAPPATAPVTTVATAGLTGDPLAPGAP